jgi:hypothetical protein
MLSDRIGRKLDALTKMCFRQARLTSHFESAKSSILNSTEILALDSGDHYDVATAQASQRPSGPLPEPTTSDSVA